MKCSVATVRVFSIILILQGSACSLRDSATTDNKLILVDGPALHQRLQGLTGASAVVVNLWATWCEPCREEFPDFVAAAKSYADKGVKVLFVSLDAPEEQAQALTFLREQKAALPSYLKHGKDHEFIMSVHEPWSGALPATIIYGPQKEKRYFWEGKVDAAQLHQALDVLVAEYRSNEK